MGNETEECQAQEILHYTQDPEHRLLNQLMARIQCPEKRRKILETFDLVADTPERLEKIRANVLAAGR